MNNSAGFGSFFVRLISSSLRLSTVNVCYLISSNRKSYNAGFACSQQPVGSVDCVRSNYVVMCTSSYLVYINNNIL